MAPHGDRGQKVWVLLSVALLMLLTDSQAEDPPSDGDLIRPVTLPEGTLVTNNEDRELSVSHRDPTGVMTKFHACSVDVGQVLLEVCLDYQQGFGDHCGIYIVDHEHFFRFHYNYILLRMLEDFCAVCEEECHGQRNEPDICSIKVWDYNDTYCDTFCNAQKQIKMENLLLDDCELHEKYYAADRIKLCSPPNTGYRKLLSDAEKEDGPSSVTTTTTEYTRAPQCLLNRWDEWVSSCDTPGYPAYDDEIGNLYGKAWLRCSFDKREGEDDPITHTGELCQEFFQRLAPCDGRGWSSRKYWDESSYGATMSPTPVTCQEFVKPSSSPITVQNGGNIPNSEAATATVKPQEQPHSSDAMAKSNVVYETKNEDSFFSSIGTVGKLVILLIAVGFAGGLATVQLRLSRNSSILSRRTGLAPSSEQQSVVESQRYYQVPAMEMHDLSLVSA